MADINYDDGHVQKVLDDDHYGLEKPKDLILEHLAVLERSAKAKGKNILFVGPPGVGKTSLGKSIAGATDREFIRMSLGDVKDAAELHGHRRTYIGALPGRIIQGLKKAKTNNPVFMLDEIDKIGANNKSDPSSALLEILDPEQNSTFQDHYLELGYDLSDILFICTANSLDIQHPVLDRLEIIELDGYTREQKFRIANDHLIEKQMDKTSLSDKELSISNEVVYDLIDYYTNEAGVRELERQIEKLCRKTARALKKDHKLSGVSIASENLADYAGLRKFTHDVKNDKPAIGEVKGLAWTSVGGETLDVEAEKWPEKGGNVIYTGTLGDVMKESIQVAESLLKSRAGRNEFGMNIEEIKKYKYHVHVPDGATPKDGPSAGAAMVTAIFSRAAEIPVRNDIAMTGEVRLNGKILPIGGLTAKLGAASRAGITTVIIPKDNEKDLADIPDEITQAFDKIVIAETIEDVLEEALVGGKELVKSFKKASEVNEGLNEIPTLMRPANQSSNHPRH